MRESTNRPVCTWVPVIDAAGRTHMEARWMPVAPDRRAAA